MRIAELRRALDSAGIHPAAYRILGEEDGRFCLTHNAPQWAVFYLERGEREAEGRYDSESEACEALLRLILSDAGVRRIDRSPLTSAHEGD